MVEMKRVRKGFYILPIHFSMTEEQDQRCREILGPTYSYGWATEPERGTDGHIYMTQQVCVRLAKDEDVVVFQMIVAS